MKLCEKHCRSCTKSTPHLDKGTISLLSPEIPAWNIAEDKLTRRFDFPDFRAAVAFVNQLTEVAEAEQHHPDLLVSYGKVDVTIQTHAVQPPGLTENDFILAARIDLI